VDSVLIPMPEPVKVLVLAELERRNRRELNYA